MRILIFISLVCISIVQAGLISDLVHHSRLKTQHDIPNRSIQEYLRAFLGNIEWLTFPNEELNEMIKLAEGLESSEAEKPEEIRAWLENERKKGYSIDHLFGELLEKPNRGKYSCYRSLPKYTMKTLTFLFNLRPNIERLDGISTRLMSVEDNDPKYNKLYHAIREYLSNQLEACFDDIEKSLEEPHVYSFDEAVSFFDRLFEPKKHKEEISDKEKQLYIEAAIANELPLKNIQKSFKFTDTRLRYTLVEFCDTIQRNSYDSVGVYILSKAFMPEKIDESKYQEAKFKKIVEYVRLCNFEVMFREQVRNGGLEIVSLPGKFNRNLKVANLINSGMT